MSFLIVRLPLQVLLPISLSFSRTCLLVQATWAPESFGIHRKEKVEIFLMERNLTTTKGIFQAACSYIIIPPLTSIPKRVLICEIPNIGNRFDIPGGSIATIGIHRSHIETEQRSGFKWHSGRCNGPLVRRACWTFFWVAGTSPGGRKLFVCHFIHLYSIHHHSSKTININISHRFFNFIKYFANPHLQSSHPWTFNPEIQVHWHALRCVILNFGSPGTFARLRILVVLVRHYLSVS